MVSAALIISESTSVPSGTVRPTPCVHAVVAADELSRRSAPT